MLKAQRGGDYTTIKVFRDGNILWTPQGSDGLQDPSGTASNEGVTKLTVAAVGDNTSSLEVCKVN